MILPLSTTKQPQTHTHTQAGGQADTVSHQAHTDSHRKKISVLFSLHSIYYAYIAWSNQFWFLHLLRTKQTYHHTNKIYISKYFTFVVCVCRHPSLHLFYSRMSVECEKISEKRSQSENRNQKVGVQVYMFSMERWREIIVHFSTRIYHAKYTKAKQTTRNILIFKSKFPKCVWSLSQLHKHKK